MTQGIKHDAEKPRWDLLPWRAVGQVVEVLTYGAKKYSPDNWKSVGSPRDRYFSAAMRHLTDWREGETRDPESGKLHLAHATCCLLFLIWFELREGVPVKKYGGPNPQCCTCGSPPSLVPDSSPGFYHLICSSTICPDTRPRTSSWGGIEAAYFEWNQIIDERRKLK